MKLKIFLTISSGSCYVCKSVDEQYSLYHIDGEECFDFISYETNRWQRLISYIVESLGISSHGTTRGEKQKSTAEDLDIEIVSHETHKKVLAELKGIWDSYGFKYRATTLDKYLKEKKLANNFVFYIHENLAKFDNGSTIYIDKTTKKKVPTFDIIINDKIVEMSKKQAQEKIEKAKWTSSYVSNITGGKLKTGEKNMQGYVHKLTPAVIIRDIDNTVEIMLKTNHTKLPISIEDMLNINISTDGIARIKRVAT